MKGTELHALAARLYPICRSITGNGVRSSLAILREQVPLQLREIPSGTTVFDWEVPLEWNIEDAAVISADGERVVDFNRHNLHLVSYSEPLDAVMSLDQLDRHLHSLPDRPDWIPYRTSYYRRTWGFCMPHSARQRLRAGRYRVLVRSSLAPGSLTYGEVTFPGRTRDEVLFFTHVCHPSLANDNTSGMAVATALARWVGGEQRRFTYRFVFAPGTIGALCWLRENESSLGRIKAGLVLGLLGDPAGMTYKESRNGGTLADATARYVVSRVDPQKGTVVSFSPYGYDERQLCSPGFDLPVGRLTRSVNGGYPEYHTSADDLNLIRPDALAQSLEACKLFVNVLEQDGRYLNRSPKGEPRLGKRGLYGALGGGSPAEREHAMLWVLNQSDGSNSLLDIARRSGLAFEILREAAVALEQAGLLSRCNGRPRSRGVGATASRSKATAGPTASRHLALRRSGAKR